MNKQAKLKQRLVSDRHEMLHLIPWTYLRFKHRFKMFLEPQKDLMVDQGRILALHFHKLVLEP
jgi:hypothetical protein